MSDTNANELSYEIKIQRINETPGIKIDSDSRAETYWRESVTQSAWYDPEREMLVAVLLNTKLATIGHSLVSLGTLNESIAHPRDVFRAAVALGAYGVIVMHNHPSGDPTPSVADEKLTLRLIECGKILGIPVLDHVVVGDGCAHSFKANGFRF